MKKLPEMFSRLFRKRKIPKGFIEVSYDGSVQMVLLSVSAIAYVDYSAKTRQAIIAINGTQYYEKNEYNPDCSVWHNKVYLNEPYEKVINLINEAQK